MLRTLGALLGLASIAQAWTDTFTLNPHSTHCFLYRGKPIVLLTATEHYGAIVNRDFDYVPYLDELARDGLNLTRVFTFFREADSSIKELGYANTLAPRPGRELMPWLRTGSRYDLTKWNPEYFARLKAFITQAGRRGIIVEVTLFTKLWEPEQWRRLPSYAANNINGVGATLKDEYQILEEVEPATFEFQKAFVRKMVQELNGFDNIYFEISNETRTPEHDAARAQRQAAWHIALAHVLKETERSLPKQHLVAVNAHQQLPAYSEGGHDYVEPGDRAYFDQPVVDLINYHYLGRKVAGRGLASIDTGMPKPGGVWDFLQARSAVGKPLVYDENFTGIVKGEKPFWNRNRIEAWETLLGGGAGFDQLEWSFTPQDPTGSGKAPIADGRRLDSRRFRRQLGVLASLWKQCDPSQMQPDADLVSSSPAHTHERLPPAVAMDRGTSSISRTHAPTPMGLAMRWAETSGCGSDRATTQPARSVQARRSGR